jgi:hypothetical protein
VPEYLLADIPEFIPRTNTPPGGDKRGKVPAFFLGERIEIDPALEKKTALFGDFRQRILEAVKDLSKHSRAKLNGEELPGKLDFLTDSQPPCRLVDLHLCEVAAHPYDLCFETLLCMQDIGNFILHDRRIEADCDHVPADLRDTSFSSGCHCIGVPPARACASRILPSAVRIRSQRSRIMSL